MSVNQGKFAELPEQLWLEICKFLKPKELCNLALVSKYFHGIANDNYAWRGIAYPKYKKSPEKSENLKKNYAEINCLATEMIIKYQSQALKFEEVLEKERTRQRKVLENKKLERQIMKSLRDLENS